MTGSINLLPKDGEVFLFPGFFTKEESDWYLDQLLKEKEEQEKEEGQHRT